MNQRRLKMKRARKPSVTRMSLSPRGSRFADDTVGNTTKMR